MHKKGIIIILLLVTFLLSESVAFAHEEEREEWLVSQYKLGNLELTPDHSLPQWSGSRMVMVKGSEGMEVDMMSVHNDTLILIMVEMDINASIDKVGVALSFNTSRVVWAWIGGKEFLVNDHDVKTMMSLKNQTLTLVFARELAYNDSTIQFKVGVPLPNFLSVIAWENGSALSQISFKDAPTLGLELLPYMDLYPKAPIVYSAIILIAGLGFVIDEIRKHDRGG